MFGHSAACLSWWPWLQSASDALGTSRLLARLALAASLLASRHRPDMLVRRKQLDTVSA
jgi:hypothetical protein